ncbi:acyl-CoA thioesterase [Sagittula stellata]|uniref:Thioesterase superfamily protein n=1 Tax=Sagittula stellata (strain ATCC 700073 / DSM 11524 / E-37) TaxID=388399 RepID=A3K778_SAGS3|nr:thioesterase family protein [Sagittula stellata]EBA06837.1 thioesterase superfamily protein [Sagittula stellata E-37]
MHFTFPQKVLFKHCDPAGIVFYPRFFEMINDAVETLFSDLLGWPFEDMHAEAGVPTAAFDVRFKRPCRHGDQLELRLTLTRLGRSSLSLTTRAVRQDTVCFEADQTLVCVDSEGRPAAWPEHVRARIEDIMEAQT